MRLGMACHRPGGLYMHTGAICNLTPGAHCRTPRCHLVKSGRARAASLIKHTARRQRILTILHATLSKNTKNTSVIWGRWVWADSRNFMTDETVGRFRLRRESAAAALINITRAQ